MKKAKISKVASLAFTLGLLAGCGRGDNEVGGDTAPQLLYAYVNVELEAVKGTLANANVSVTPYGETEVIGSGETDASGATLLTLESEIGAGFFGLYEITVTADSDSSMICTPTCVAM